MTLKQKIKDALETEFDNGMFIEIYSEDFDRIVEITHDVSVEHMTERGLCKCN